MASDQEQAVAVMKFQVGRLADPPRARACRPIEGDTDDGAEALALLFACLEAVLGDRYAAGGEPALLHAVRQVRDVCQRLRRDPYDVPYPLWTRELAEVVGVVELHASSEDGRVMCTVPRSLDEDPLSALWCTLALARHHVFRSVGPGVGDLTWWVGALEDEARKLGEDLPAGRAQPGDSARRIEERWRESPPPSIAHPTQSFGFWMPALAVALIAAFWPGYDSVWGFVAAGAAALVIGVDELRVNRPVVAAYRIGWLVMIVLGGRIWPPWGALIGAVLPFFWQAQSLVIEDRRRRSRFGA